ncbi:hypothetical protein [Chitinophaga polysaccharea]|uniref:hypothetical protein n=1 Tax=Chitinophaga polysaccharea TaxID=1293035 RepID=UPI00115B6E3A|nr:hypothetical protein [Chitinophaga polysaccharea]
MDYPKNRKEYNGIEHTTDLDLNQYDAFFRTLDPQIGKWSQIDPKIEDMEAWSPYASNYDNPTSYADFLGDEPDDDPPTGVRGFWISVAGLINGINHTITGGHYNTPASAFGWDGEDAERYDNMTRVGEIIPVVLSPKPSAAQPTPVPLEPIPVPLQAPAPIPVVVPPSTVNTKGKKPDWGKAGGAEHTSGARGSTKGKHEKGAATNQRNRQGSKGMDQPPRRRPAGHKGPWPPKPAKPVKPTKPPASSPPPGPPPASTPPAEAPPTPPTTSTPPTTN